MKVMNESLSQKLLELVRRDERVRADLVRRGELFDGYHPEMEAVHNENADFLSAIIEESGWPNEKEIGEAVSRAAWLIVQHAIGKPAFQKRCLALLRTEVEQGRFDPAKVALLEDRIAVFEGRPQIYGTQFDWDTNGTLSPNLIENPDHVDQLRAAVGLPTLAETTRLVRQRATEEGNRAPNNLTKRNEVFLAWLHRTGWRR